MDEDEERINLSVRMEGKTFSCLSLPSPRSNSGERRQCHPPVAWYMRLAGTDRPLFQPGKPDIVATLRK